MKPYLSLLSSILWLLVINSSSHAQQPPTPSLVDMKSFVSTSQEVEKYRQNRLLSLQEFLEVQQQSDVILLVLLSHINYQ